MTIIPLITVVVVAICLQRVQSVFSLYMLSNALRSLLSMIFSALPIRSKWWPAARPLF